MYHLQMCHGRGRHFLHELDFFGRQTISRLVVHDSIDTDAASRWRGQWYASIESRLWARRNERPIAKVRVFEQIVDDEQVSSIRMGTVGARV